MSLLDVLASETSEALSNTSEWAEVFFITIAGETGFSEVTGFFDKTYIQIDPSTGMAVQSNAPRVVFCKFDVERIVGQTFPEDGSNDWVIERLSTGQMYYIAKVVERNEYILQVDLVKINA